jgi:transcriptional regulator with XRE-family HTH domain
MLECGMARSSLDRAVDRASRSIRTRLAEDLERLAADAGVSHAALSRTSGVPASFLSRILSGTTKPSLETYARLAGALGADLSVRLYPNTGPAIRDRHSVPILEALLEALDPRWKPYTEVHVVRPARGSIDAVQHEPRERLPVATEIESMLRRVEQLVR